MPGAPSICGAAQEVTEKDASSDHILILEAGRMGGKCKARGDYVKSKQARDARRDASIGQSRAPEVEGRSQNLSVSMGPEVQ